MKSQLKSLLFDTASREEQEEHRRSYARKKNSEQGGAGLRDSGRYQQGVRSVSGHPATLAYLRSYASDSLLPSIECNARMMVWPWRPRGGSFAEHLQNEVRKGLGVKPMKPHQKRRSMIRLGLWRMSEMSNVSIMMHEPVPATVLVEMPRRLAGKVAVALTRLEVKLPSSTGLDAGMVMKRHSDHPAVTGRRALAALSLAKIWGEEGVRPIHCNMSHSTVYIVNFSAYGGIKVFTAGHYTAKILQRVGNGLGIETVESIGDLSIKHNVGVGKGCTLRMNTNGNYTITGHPTGIETVLTNFRRILNTAMTERYYEEFLESLQYVSDAPLHAELS